MTAITPATAKEHGFSRAALYRAAERGTLERIAPGIFLPADSTAADRDLLEAALRRPEATICLTSALALHELIDEIPATLDIAINAAPVLRRGTPPSPGTTSTPPPSTSDANRSPSPAPSRPSASSPPNDQSPMPSDSAAPSAMNSTRRPQGMAATRRQTRPTGRARHPTATRQRPTLATLETSHEHGEEVLKRLRAAAQSSPRPDRPARPHPGALHPAPALIVPPPAQPHRARAGLRPQGRQSSWPSTTPAGPPRASTPTRSAPTSPRNTSPPWCGASQPPKPTTASPSVETTTIREIRDQIDYPGGRHPGRLWGRRSGQVGRLDTWATTGAGYRGISRRPGHMVGPDP